MNLNTKGSIETYRVENTGQIVVGPLLYVVPEIEWVNSVQHFPFCDRCSRRRHSRWNWLRSYNLKEVSVIATGQLLRDIPGGEEALAVEVLGPAPEASGRSGPNCASGTSRGSTFLSAAAAVVDGTADGTG